MVRINGKVVTFGGTRNFAECSDDFRWKGADNADAISKCLSCDKRFCDNCMGDVHVIGSKVDRESIIKLLKGGMAPVYVARRFGVHPSTITRIKKELKGEQNGSYQV